MQFAYVLFCTNAVNAPGKHRDFGGLDKGDDRASLLNPGIKPLTQIVQDDSFREFEFRQYLFACQSKVRVLRLNYYFIFQYMLSCPSVL